MKAQDLALLMERIISSDNGKNGIENWMQVKRAKLENGEMEFSCGLRHKDISTYYDPIKTEIKKTRGFTPITSVVFKFNEKDGIYGLTVRQDAQVKWDYPRPDEEEFIKLLVRRFNIKEL